MSEPTSYRLHMTCGCVQQGDDGIVTVCPTHQLMVQDVVRHAAESVKGDVDALRQQLAQAQQDLAATRSILSVNGLIEWTAKWADEKAAREALESRLREADAALAQMREERDASEE